MRINVFGKVTQSHLLSLLTNHYGMFMRLHQNQGCIIYCFVLKRTGSFSHTFSFLWFNAYLHVASSSNSFHASHQVLPQMWYIVKIRYQRYKGTKKNKKHKRSQKAHLNLSPYQVETVIHLSWPLVIRSLKAHWHQMKWRTKNVYKNLIRHLHCSKYKYNSSKQTPEV